MTPHPHPWWMSLLLPLFGLPWLAGIAWAWRHRVRDGAIPPSLGERARRGLSGRI